MQDPIPFDTAIHAGKLANGFSYFIRRTDDPKGKVTLRLVVKAGYEHEAQDQLELAHLLEHMPFAGTTHFPDPLAFFQSHGLRVGVEINARTLSDWTDYRMNKIEATNTKLVHKGIKFLRDCADGVLLDSVKIESERDVVLREITLKSEINTSIEDQYMFRITENPAYHLRVARTKQNLQSFNHASLIRFYTQWYRPDRQALLVTGDIDVANIERLVRTLFADMKYQGAPLELREQKCIDQSFLDGQNGFIKMTRPDLDNVVFYMFMKHPCSIINTKEDYRLKLMMDLYNKMVTRRLYSWQLRKDSPLMNGSHELRGRHFVMGRDFGLLYSIISVKRDREQEGFKLFMSELQRIKLHGFTASEMRWAKESLGLSRPANYGDNCDEISLNLVNHFVYGTPAPDPAYERNLHAQLLETITVADMHTLARQWITHKNTDIVLLSPDENDMDLPAEQDITHWLAEIEQTAMDPPVDEPSLRPLMSPGEITSLQGGSVQVREHITDINVTRIVLKNDVQVYLKPVETPDDRICLVGFSVGGTSQYPDTAQGIASHAAHIIGNSGLGDLDRFELLKYQKLKGVWLKPFIQRDHDGFSGNAKVSDLEALLQMVYLNFTKPRKDHDVLNQYLDGLKTIQEPDPTMSFRLEIMRTIDETAHKTMTAKTAFALDDIYAIYRNRFGNGQDFGFVLSGNFEVERIIPLIQKYLGSLPSKDIEVESLKRNYQVSRRNVKRTFHGRLDSNDATVQLIYRNVGDTRSDHLTMETMAHAMEIMLGQRLRRQNGGTYMVTVSYRKEQPGGHGFFVDFDCDPKDVEKMIDDVSKVINEMTSGGMPPAVVQNAIAIRKQVLDKEMMDSRFWPNYIKGQVREGRDLSEIVQQELHLEQITSGSLQRSSKRFFRQAQRMEFVLLP